MHSKFYIEPTVRSAAAMLPPGFDFEKAVWWKKIEEENRTYLYKMLGGIFLAAFAVALCFFAHAMLTLSVIPPLRYWLAISVTGGMALAYAFLKYNEIFAVLALIMAVGGIVCGEFLPLTYGIDGLIFICLPALVFLFFGIRRGRRFVTAFGIAGIAMVALSETPLMAGLALAEFPIEYKVITLLLYQLVAVFISRLQKAYELTIAGLIKYFAFDETTGMPTRNILRYIPRNNATFAILHLASLEDIRSMFGYDVAESAMSFVSEHLKRLELGFRFSTFRLKGNEFGLLFRTDGIEPTTIHTMESLSKLISAKEFAYDDMKIRLSFVIGFDEHLEDLTLPCAKDDFLFKADIALKEGIRNKSAVMKYSKDQNVQENAGRNLANYSILVRNIEECALKAMFQPVIEVSSGLVAWHEALVRIKTGTGDYVSPLEYLDLCSSTGLSRDIAFFMIERAFEMIDQTDSPVSVNLSRSDIVDDRMRSMIIAHTKRIIGRGRLIVELLESEKYGSETKLAESIRELRAHGVLLAIDDFGSGYSNLANFIDLEVDIIKIDGQLIKRAETDHKLKAFIAGTVRFCANSGIRTVAEHVDTPELAAYLKGEGVDFFQGYLFGRPETAPVATIHVPAGRQVFREQGLRSETARKATYSSE